MKKTFENPEMNIEKFEMEDVMTESTGGTLTPIDPDEGVIV